MEDLNAEKRELKIVRAVNQCELHTPKCHRMNRPIRLTENDVQRLLRLKESVNGQEEDWMFPNRIKNGSIMKSGPIWHETLLARRIQPLARELGLPHITLRLLRHWGAPEMVEANTPIKAVQQRLGHSRAQYCSHLLCARPRQIGGLGGIVGERTAERSTCDRRGWSLNHFAAICLQLAAPRQRCCFSLRCKCFKNLEARVGIEPTHKGFAVFRAPAK
ncbi:MAG: tyrosine-type recombinase/integrase [Acidobacteriota bacterium]|nr:tyrosine-type recombinase/integrase [Acidobacteriota bacterium]